MADLSKINVNNTEYDLKDSGALPTSGGEMTGTITTPADNSKGITPKTDRTGILGSITKWFNLLHVQDIRTQAIKFFGTSTTSASTNGYTLYASGTPSSNVNINVADLLTKPELDGTVFVEKTWAEYDALSEAQKNDGKVNYYITDLEDIGYAVQDDPTATDLVNDEVPTGGTLSSVLNSNFGNIRFIINDDVEFTFSNKNITSVSVQTVFGNDVDMSKFITLMAVGIGGAFSFGIGSNKTGVSAMYNQALNATYHVGIIGVFYK